ncbi:conserved hypothetical protein [Trichinella spiralis]|uniref:Uncharacterized protein n=1 Tax=Trichinella spiralis TaxID=6334 RepID=E5S085_TRISP|nr:conserved hypothetical protein [Trichinella spiralis]KRY28618.1 hypothetical protein T01_5589 [Trichinella spiralis]
MQPIYQLNVEQTLEKLQKSNKKLQLASLASYSRSTTQEIDVKQCLHRDELVVNCSMASTLFGLNNADSMAAHTTPILHWIKCYATLTNTWQWNNSVATCTAGSARYLRADRSFCQL